MLLLFSILQFVRVAKQIMGSSLSDVHVVVRLPLSILAFVLKNVVLMYPVTMFMLLSWEHCFKVGESFHDLRMCSVSHHTA